MKSDKFLSTNERERERQREGEKDDAISSKRFTTWILTQLSPALNHSHSPARPPSHKLKMFWGGWGSFIFSLCRDEWRREDLENSSCVRVGKWKAHIQAGGCIFLTIIHRQRPNPWHSERIVASGWLSFSSDGAAGPLPVAWGLVAYGALRRWADAGLEFLKNTFGLPAGSQIPDRKERHGIVLGRTRYAFATWHVTANHAIKPKIANLISQRTDKTEDPDPRSFPAWSAKNKLEFLWLWVSGGL